MRVSPFSPRRVALGGPGGVDRDPLELGVAADVVEVGVGVHDVDGAVGEETVGVQHPDRGVFPLDGLTPEQTAQVVEATEDHVSAVLNRSRMALAAD